MRNACVISPTYSKFKKTLPKTSRGCGTLRACAPLAVGNMLTLSSCALSQPQSVIKLASARAPQHRLPHFAARLCCNRACCGCAFTFALCSAGMSTAGIGS